jgi:hypothetical protein
VYGLQDILQLYQIRGWHCTRLTDEEADSIIEGGMCLPDAAMLARRIERLVQQGLLTRQIAERLKTENQAHETNRAGMVWFCFFAPHIGGESGIERFFRHWGGEALYNLHEDDPLTSPAISCIGTPCLVEANVPISSLEKYGGLDSKVIRRYLISRGLVTREPVDHEDRIKRPLSAEHVRRIIRFPEPDFLSLTGCAEWRIPLASLGKSR